jgi:hypothetical protein
MYSGKSGLSRGILLDKVKSASAKSKLPCSYTVYRRFRVCEEMA